MKRVLTAVLAAIALASVAAPAGAGVSAARHRSFTAYYYGNDGGIWLTAWQSTDLATGAETANACANINVGANYDSGCGPITVTMDPLSTMGTIRGTVPGYFGPIKIDFTFLRSQVSNTIPFVMAEAVPQPASANAVAASGINGRSNGSVGTAFAAFTVVNAPTNVYDVVNVAASA